MRRRVRKKKRIKERKNSKMMGQKGALRWILMQARISLI